MDEHRQGQTQWAGTKDEEEHKTGAAVQIDRPSGTWPGGPGGRRGETHTARQVVKGSTRRDLSFLWYGWQRLPRFFIQYFLWLTTRRILIMF